MILRSCLSKMQRQPSLAHAHRSCIRSVRTDRYLYIRNFYPQRPLLQPNAYKDGKAILQSLRALRETGKLDSLTEKLLFSSTRPAEELFFRRNDPNDVRLGEIVGKAARDYESARIVILGCPQDEGVKRNGGREGAAGIDRLSESDFERFVAALERSF